MAIDCCNGCVAPKRHIGCHATCSEYIEQSAKHVEEREAKRKRQAVSNGLYESKSRIIKKALKNKRHG